MLKFISSIHFSAVVSPHSKRFAVLNGLRIDLFKILIVPYSSITFAGVIDLATFITESKYDFFYIGNPPLSVSVMSGFAEESRGNIILLVPAESSRLLRAAL